MVTLCSSSVKTGVTIIVKSDAKVRLVCILSNHDKNSERTPWYARVAAWVSDSSDPPILLPSSFQHRESLVTRSLCILSSLIHSRSASSVCPPTVQLSLLIQDVGDQCAAVQALFPGNRTNNQ
eukprot:3919322-Rhodomonas_salina.1